MLLVSSAKMRGLTHQSNTNSARLFPWQNSSGHIYHLWNSFIIKVFLKWNKAKLKGLYIPPVDPYFAGKKLEQ